MGLFGRNKKIKNTKKVDENPDWNKDLKRNIINKTRGSQQGLNLQENVDLIGSKYISGIKKGLSSDQFKILKNCEQESTAAELIKILQRTSKTKFKTTILKPLVNYGFFELTIPSKNKDGKEIWSTSPKLKYRLTGKFVRKRVRS